MAQKYFYYDQTYCTGCRSCEVACQVENNLDPDAHFREVTYHEGGTFPDVWAASLSIACNHCETPACMAVCPVNALSKEEDTGLVLLNKELCISCGTCITACPYGAPTSLADGSVGKCEGCRQLLALGEKPACVAICSMRCLFFGEEAELKSTIGSKETVKDISPIADSVMTNPSLLITPKKEML
jgi:anaerobic dimethyl sulfoxide reductase subunit B (iron-sulfur subunit)